MDCGVRSRLNATVIAVDRFMLANVCILEAGGFLLRNENLNILAKCTLIAFEREDVVGFLLEDFLGDFALTAHRVDRNNGALDGQHLEERGDQSRWIFLPL